MNLLIDENLTPSIVQRLAAKGVVAVHVAHIGLPGATDPEVWRYAFEHDQIVVTINAADFIRLAESVELHGPPLRGGRVEVPTLERNLQGWTGYITLEGMSSRGIRLPDVCPCEERSACACYVEGLLGTWSFYSDVFEDSGLDLESYFEAGIRNLFVRGWFRHVLENGFDSISPAALRARVALGFGTAERGTP